MDKCQIRVIVSTRRLLELATIPSEQDTISELFSGQKPELRHPLVFHDSLHQDLFVLGPLCHLLQQLSPDLERRLIRSNKQEAKARETVRLMLGVIVPDEIVLLLRFQ
tara:strand:+ start:301 stop:624 length:324 start_codon:yes stop_codon:yes gene_type:complete